MAFVTWVRALQAVGTVAEATRLFRESRGPSPASPATFADGTGLEVRLANVVVAALKEAFDRDRARFDLERELHEAEQARRQEALRLEWLRQTGAQALTQTRQLALLGIVVWIASAAAAGWLAPLSAVGKSLLALGWLGLIGAVCAAFLTHQRLTEWLARDAAVTVTSPPAQGVPRLVSRVALPWLLIGGFLLTAAGLLTEF